jgi:hypothetical protein
MLQMIVNGHINCVHHSDYKILYRFLVLKSYILFFEIIELFYSKDYHRQTKMYFLK